MRLRPIDTVRINARGRGLAAALVTAGVMLGITTVTRSDDAPGESVTEYESTARRLISLVHEPRAAAASSDGTLLGTGHDDGLVVLWNTETGLPVQSLSGHQETVSALAFDSSVSRIASAAYDSTIHVWNVTDGSLLDVLSGHTGRLTSIVFSPDGRQLASGAYDKTVRLWDLGADEVKSTVVAEFDAKVEAIAFSPDGTQLACSDSAGGLRLFSLNDLAQPPVVVDGIQAHSLLFSPSGDSLLTGTAEGQVVTWDSQTLERTGQIAEAPPRPLHTAPVATLAFSPDGRLLSTADREGLTHVWDLELETITSVLDGHDDEVLAIAFLPAGAALLTVSRDRTVNTWRSRLPLTPRLAEINDIDARLWTLTVSQNNTLFAGGRRSFLTSWNLESGQRKQVFEGFDGTIDALALTTDAAYLACCGWKEESIFVFNAATGERMTELAAGVKVRCVRFSPDGQTLVAGCEDGALRIWSWQTDENPQSVPTGSLAVYDIAFSPDGTKVVSCSGDWRNPEPGEVTFWNTGDWTELRRLTGHSHAVRSLAFSSDGSRVASAAEDGRVIVSNAENYVTLAEFQNSDGTRPIAFSPDGSFLAVGLHDGTINIWDTQRGEVVQRFQSEDDVFAVSFSSDGAALFSVSGEERIEVWPVIGKAAEESSVIQTIKQWSMQPPGE